MKRFLHALAALWPKRKEVGNPPTPPTSNGLRQHLAAVLRIEGYLSECTDIHSRKRTTVTSDIHPARREVEWSGSPNPRTERSDAWHPSRKAGSQTVGITERNAVTSRQVKRSGSPNQQLVESPNQPPSLPRIPQPMPLLTILMLVFFMCLMAAKQVSAQAEPAEAAKWIIPHGGVVLGDSLPDWFWEVELSVVNHPEGNEIVRMADYKDKLLVLDFWATYCSPCVASLIKWDSLARFFSGQVAVIGIHLFDFAQRAQPFAEKMGWILPIADGNATDTLLNQLFYERRRFGQVWVKDGRLLAIPKNKVVSRELVSAVLLGARPEIEMEESHTYFDPERERKTEY